ncbi:MAG: hypothetical protein AAGL68_09275, partial [Pseudomonadota bacterium]
RTGCSQNRRAGSSFAPTCSDFEGSYGRNLIPRGDFENTRFEEAGDRFWMSRNASIDFRQNEDGEGTMALLADGGGKSAYLYSRSYIRDVYATRFTLESRIKLPRPATIELIVKERPQEGAAPTSSIRGVSLGTKRIGIGGWNKLRFEFDRPEEANGAARAFRVILKIRFEDRKSYGDKTIELDDFALIEWPDEALQRDPTQAWRWTHARQRQLASAPAQ